VFYPYTFANSSAWKAAKLMSDWPDLTHELDEWEAADLTATFWWRDDDAVKPTEQLDRLLTVAKTLPIALSVISGSAEKKILAEQLCDVQRISVLQHGWHHTNHGASICIYSEYPGNRPTDDVISELQDGRKQMSTFFGKLFQPVFTPPWHAFDDKFLPLLSESGLWSISRIGPRGSGAAKAAKIFECNIHADLLIWQCPPKFVGEETAIDMLLKHLKGRRLGDYDPAEPTGILTHHEYQDSLSYNFIERLAEVTSNHKTAKWLAASEIFPSHSL
jgi:hypothetical protein